MIIRAGALKVPAIIATPCAGSTSRLVSVSSFGACLGFPSSLLPQRNPQPFQPVVELPPAQAEDRSGPSAGGSPVSSTTLPGASWASKSLRRSPSRSYGVLSLTTSWSFLPGTPPTYLLVTIWRTAKPPGIHSGGPLRPCPVGPGSRSSDHGYKKNPDGLATSVSEIAPPGKGGSSGSR